MVHVCYVLSFRPDCPARPGPGFDLCDDSERHAIKQSGGDAEVATMLLQPSLKLLVGTYREVGFVAAVLLILLYPARNAINPHSC